jgi:hypothetical protein
MKYLMIALLTTGCATHQSTPVTQDAINTLDRTIQMQQQQQMNRIAYIRLSR